MFNFSKKERAREAIYRGTKAALTGGFFHYSDAQKFGLNEQATAWLYTEALALQIYTLVTIFNNKLGGRHKWANVEFVVEAIEKATKEYEKENGLKYGSVGHFVINRMVEIDQMAPDQRRGKEHLWESAQKVKNFDKFAPEEELVDSLDSACLNYFNNAIKMFS